MRPTSSSTLPEPSRVAGRYALSCTIPRVDHQQVGYSHRKPASLVQPGFRRSTWLAVMPDRLSQYRNDHQNPGVGRSAVYEVSRLALPTLGLTTLSGPLTVSQGLSNPGCGSTFFLLVVLFKQLYWLVGHYRGNGVLVDKLGMPIPS